jgi:hypothetical protein
MAFNNVNYSMIPLTSGTYTGNDLGNGITGSCVCQIQCLTAGSITVSALGGGIATFTLTAGQTIDVMVGACTVVSGTYVGFKPAFSNKGMGAISWGGNL